MREHHETVIIGGGQAGLAMSYCLRARGREHIILERKRVGERWRSERWNSLAFQFPNWSLKLPGYSYSGSAPNAFAHYSEITKFIEAYASHIDAPLRCSSEVRSLREGSDPGNYLVDTGDHCITTSCVVIATGPFQQPSIPALAAAFPTNIFQVHASHYLDPHQLPPGAVLVVGSGTSGCQIAEELYQSGRTVYLSASRHRRVPRRYRDRDLLWWLLALGRMDLSLDNFPDRKMPPSLVITGVNGGHDINLRHFAKDGVVILGRLLGAADGGISLGDDVEPILAEADGAYAQFRRDADGYALKAQIAAPEEDGEVLVVAPIEPISTLNLKAANITSVVWSTGYRFDFDWVKLPVFDQHGAPVQQRGVTACKNIYFLGLHWMHRFKSGVFFGVGEDAAYLADHIDASI